MRVPQAVSLTALLLATGCVDLARPPHLGTELPDVGVARPDAAVPADGAAAPDLVERTDANIAPAPDAAVDEAIDQRSAQGIDGAQDVGQAVVESLGTDLVGYWKLDETAGTMASDSSGNRNQGVIFGPAAWTTGHIRGALALDGSSTWINVMPSQSIERINTGNRVTVAAWAMHRAARAGWTTIVSRQYMDTNADRFGLFFFGTENVVRFTAASVEPGTTWCDSPAVPTGQWLHVAGTYDGTSGRLYVNGNEVCSWTHAAAIGGGMNSVLIGGSANDATKVVTEALNGTLDEVMLWSRTLAGAEIRQLAMGLLPPAR